MNEKPILFSTAMVQAIKEKRKSKTRRTQGLDHINDLTRLGHKFRIDYTNERQTDKDGDIWFERMDGDEPTEDYYYATPRYKVGDHLWVRETFGMLACDGMNEQITIYKADKEGDKDYDSIKWKPSLFMPKELARIWLEVTNVRCERLHDITEKEAIAEGVLSEFPASWANVLRDSKFIIPRPFSEHQFSFMVLWAKINGVKNWDSNPWVFVYEFKRIEKSHEQNPHVNKAKKRIYNIRYKLRKQGYEIKKKTLLIPAEEFVAKEYKKPIIGKYVNELKSFGYGIQSIIQ